MALFSGEILVQNVREKALLQPGEVIFGVNRGSILSGRIEKLTQQLQLQVEPSELVSGRSPQKLALRIKHVSGKEKQLVLDYHFGF